MAKVGESGKGPVGPVGETVLDMSGNWGYNCDMVTVTTTKGTTMTSTPTHTIASQRIVTPWSANGTFPMSLTEVELGLRAGRVQAFGDDTVNHLLVLHAIDPDHSRRRGDR